MPEREGFPPPEALTPLSEDSPTTLEVNSSDVLELETEKISRADQTRLQEKTDHPDVPEQEDGTHRAEDEWDREGKRAEVLREYTLGLGDLYDLLPRRGQINMNDVQELIEHTGLRVLWPSPRKDLTTAVIKESLNEKGKAEFLSRGLEILADVIGTEAIHRAGDEWLDQQQVRRNEQFPPESLNNPR